MGHDYIGDGRHDAGKSTIPSTRSAVRPGVETVSMGRVTPDMMPARGHHGQHSCEAFGGIAGVRLVTGRDSNDMSVEDAFPAYNTDSSVFSPGLGPVQLAYSGVGCCVVHLQLPAIHRNMFLLPTSIITHSRLVCTAKAQRANR